jgi:hypothetical protein
MMPEGLRPTTPGCFSPLICLKLSLSQTFDKISKIYWGEKYHFEFEKLLTLLTPGALIYIAHSVCH